MLITCTTLGDNVCRTEKGRECKFPFEYKGKIYNGCANIEESTNEKASTEKLTTEKSTTEKKSTENLSPGQKARALEIWPELDSDPDPLLRTNDNSNSGKLWCLTGGFMEWGYCKANCPSHLG